MGIDCQLERQLANFCRRYFEGPNVASCHYNSQCAIRDCNAVYFNQLPRRFRCANQDYFTRPCGSFPSCKDHHRQSRRCRCYC